MNFSSFRNLVVVSLLLQLNSVIVNAESNNSQNNDFVFLNSCIERQKVACSDVERARIDLIEPNRILEATKEAYDDYMETQVHELRDAIRAGTFKPLYKNSKITPEYVFSVTEYSRKDPIWSFIKPMRAAQEEVNFLTEVLRRKELTVEENYNSCNKMVLCENLEQFENLVDSAID